jgi:hypothetical protein
VTNYNYALYKSLQHYLRPLRIKRSFYLYVGLQRRSSIKRNLRPFPGDDFSRSCFFTQDLRRNEAWAQHIALENKSPTGYIRYVPRPTSRGSALLYMSRFSYKRGGMQRYNIGSTWRLRLSSFHSNPTHSGVGCYAPAARTTLNSRVFMCLMFA